MKKHCIYSELGVDYLLSQGYEKPVQVTGTNLYFVDKLGPETDNIVIIY